MRPANVDVRRLAHKRPGEFDVCCQANPRFHSCRSLSQINPEICVMEKFARDAGAAPRARDMLRGFGKTVWYLRAVFAVLVLSFVLLTTAMYCLCGPVETVSRTSSSLGETVYFCAITALTIGYGDVVPTTALGRIDAVLLGLIGLLITGLITAAAVRGVQEASHRFDTRH
jgi:voltage-gated potassium channel